jgi:hypothetical protein
MIKFLRRRVVKPILKSATASFYRGRPIADWPSYFTWLHEISVPRGMVPHETPQPIGAANVNNLFQLIDETRDVPGDLAECGVWRGQSLVPMGIYLQQKGIPKRIYGFDSFEGFAESVVLDRQLGGTHQEWKQAGVKNDTSIDIVHDKLDRFGVRNVELVKGFFEHTLPRYADRAFSFVHLDCDAYSAYKECLEFFYPRLSRGGIVLFDEYDDPPWPGCNQAVDEFLAGKPETLRTIARDNHVKSYFPKA